jgi:hypothetical protein
VNVKRKIQLAAVVVIANSILALQWPRTAEATTCGPQSFCTYDYGCYPPVDAVALCADYAPPGCVVASGFCNTLACFGYGSVYCNFVPG